MNGDPLLSFMCMGVKQAEPGTPSKVRGPSTKVLTLKSKKHPHPAEPVV